MFSCDDISGINYIRLISNPIQAPSHEFDEIEIKMFYGKSEITFTDVSGV
jgi:hypothetical protein